MIPNKGIFKDQVTSKKGRFENFDYRLYENRSMHRRVISEKNHFQSDRF